MTDVTLHELLADWEATRDGHRDHTQVTPSAAGTLCLRQTAYSLNLVPRSDSPDPVTVATVGSLIHLGVATLWDAEPRTLATEHPLEVGGQIDCLRAAAGKREVRDLKTVSRSKFDGWVANAGPPEAVWQQLAEYGSRYRAESGTPSPIVLIVDAICRETGRCATFERDWTPEAAEAAKRTLDRVEALRGVEPLDVPTSRTGRGDWLCDSCPWLSDCMGPDDSTPEVTEVDARTAEAAAYEYAKWQATAKHANEQAAEAKAVLRGFTGRAGSWEVKWSERSGGVVPEYVRAPSRVLSVKWAP